MKETRESVPGLAGVRIGYIRKACEGIQGRVIGIVQKMFEVRANEWDELVKVGAMVPLHKKGARDQANNFRVVCLLSMCSRVLGRVIAKRVGRCSEHLKLLDENQAGFRKGMSTSDVVQVMQRIQKDVVDCKRLVNDGANGMNEDEWPCARLCARVLYGSGCQGVRLRVKGCEKGGAGRQKRYVSIVCCLQMI